MRGSLAALSVAVAFFCSPTALAQEAVYDPHEGLNRDLFAAHEAIDGAVLEPLARGYRAIMPRPLRSGVSNFLRNLKAPVIFANDVLQAEPARAGTTLARFGLNSTIGVLGVFDPAASMGLERHDEDFGQTLAVWGLSEGPYFFVPVLGPTNLRDGAGRIIDLTFDPLNWAEFDEADEARAIRGVLTGISAREALLDQVDNIRENSVDPYVTFRSSYQLFRDSAVLNGRSEVQDLPEFEDVPADPAAPPADVAEKAESTPMSLLVQGVKS
jgi:phospholipid-binding lipoprotein MlaA